MAIKNLEIIANGEKWRAIKVNDYVVLQKKRGSKGGWTSIVSVISKGRKRKKKEKKIQK